MATWIFCRRTSMESWTPKSAPTATRSRVPPSARWRGSPRRLASSTHQAISRAARATGWRWARSHVLAHGVEGGERVLGRVTGQQGRAALAPSRVAAAFHTHEYRVGIVLVCVGGLPDEGERKPRPVDVDALDLHPWVLSGEARERRRRVTRV